MSCPTEVLGVDYPSLWFIYAPTMLPTYIYTLDMRVRTIVQTQQTGSIIGAIISELLHHNNYLLSWRPRTFNSKVRENWRKEGCQRKGSRQYS